MSKIQRFPRPHRFRRSGPPRVVEYVEGEDMPDNLSVKQMQARAAFYGIPWEEYQESWYGLPMRFRPGVGYIPLRFPREKSE